MILIITYFDLAKYTLGLKLQTQKTNHYEIKAKCTIWSLCLEFVSDNLVIGGSKGVGVLLSTNTLIGSCCKFT